MAGRRKKHQRAPALERRRDPWVHGDAPGDGEKNRPYLSHNGHVARRHQAYTGRLEPQFPVWEELAWKEKERYFYTHDGMRQFLVATIDHGAQEQQYWPVPRYYVALRTCVGRRPTTEELGGERPFKRDPHHRRILVQRVHYQRSGPIFFGEFRTIFQQSYRTEAEVTAIVASLKASPESYFAVELL